MKLTIISEQLMHLVVGWIRENLPPEDVFTDAELNDWATHNGYKKENENGE